MKRFFYASAAILMLAIAYHLGASTASAQAPSNPVVTVYSGGSPLAITANGDCFLATDSNGLTWHRTGNVFSGGATPALHESWGQLKSRYRATPLPTPGMTATPNANDR